MANNSVVSSALRAIKHNGFWVLRIALDKVPKNAVNTAEFGVLASSKLHTALDSRKLSWWCGRRALLSVIMNACNISRSEAYEFMIEHTVIGPHGKPYFLHKDLSFSISHSANRLFMIVSALPTAIDCEVVQVRKSYKQVLERMLKDQERDFVLNSLFDPWLAKQEVNFYLSEPCKIGTSSCIEALNTDKLLKQTVISNEQMIKYWLQDVFIPNSKLELQVPFSELSRFFMLWTIKETAVKLTGKGLSGLSEFDFDIEHNHIFHKNEHGFIASTMLLDDNEAYGLSCFLPLTLTKRLSHMVTKPDVDRKLKLTEEFGVFTDFDPVSMSFMKMQMPTFSKIIKIGSNK